MIVWVGSPGRSRTRLNVKKVTRSSTIASWTKRRPISRAASTFVNPPARWTRLGYAGLSTASRSLLAEGVDREPPVERQRLGPVGQRSARLAGHALRGQGPLR